LGTLFEIKERWAPFLPRFSGILLKFCPDFQDFCPDFRQMKTFGGALAPPAAPPPTPLVPDR